MHVLINIAEAYIDNVKINEAEFSIEELERYSENCLEIHLSTKQLDKIFNACKLYMKSSSADESYHAFDILRTF